VLTDFCCNTDCERLFIVVERKLPSLKQVKAATMSLAEELQAAVRAAAEASGSERGAAELRQPLTLPLGVSLDGDDAPQNRRSCIAGISQFLVDVSELGTPDYVDPVNKYRDVVCDLAYGCVYRPYECDSESDKGRELDDRYRSPSLISQSSTSSLSGSMLPGADECTESGGVTAAMTRLPSLTLLRRSEEEEEEDDDRVVTKGMMSRVAECLPDVIAATVGAASRAERERDRLHSDADDLSYFDFNVVGSSQGSKKSSLHGGCIDRTTSLESSVHIIQPRLP
jgi:hypothetical protein